MDLIFNRTVVNSLTPLDILERRADNTYLYRYDLHEIPQEESDDSEMSPMPEGNMYSYVSVMLNGYPNKNEVIKHLIRQLLTEEDELKIINDYNEVINLIPEYESTDEYRTYMNYLIIRHEIKSKVNEDFKNLNI